MALDDLKTLRQKTVVELEKLGQELRDQLWQLRADLARGKVKNIQELRATRLQIARVMTLIKEANRKSSARGARPDELVGRESSSRGQIADRT